MTYTQLPSHSPVGPGYELMTQFLTCGSICCSS